MPKFIYSSLAYILPFFILYAFFKIFYRENEGDLLRIGYIPYVHRDYRMIFNTYLQREIKFTELSKAKKKPYKIMTIGDSFSELGPCSYKNKLAFDFDLLHVDRFISDNQIQTLINLCNGDFFDHYPVQFVILQNVERHLIDNTLELNMTGKLSTKTLDSIFSNQKPYHEETPYKFFTQSTLKFPLYHFPRYMICNNYLSNENVYNVKLNNDHLFSCPSDKLLFYYKDLANTSKNNDPQKIKLLNQILNTINNKLKSKNITLIVLPSPDKYDFYYEFIEDKTLYARPNFFENFDNLSKNYIYIDSKRILKSAMKHQKDIYYFDDSHWSPISADLIANYIKQLIIRLDKKAESESRPKETFIKDIKTHCPA